MALSLYAFQDAPPGTCVLLARDANDPTSLTEPSSHASECAIVTKENMLAAIIVQVDPDSTFARSFLAQNAAAPTAVRDVWIDFYEPGSLCASPDAIPTLFINTNQGMRICIGTDPAGENVRIPCWDHALRLAASGVICFVPEIIVQSQTDPVLLIQIGIRLSQHHAHGSSSSRKRKSQPFVQIAADPDDITAFHLRQLFSSLYPAVDPQFKINAMGTILPKNEMDFDVLEPPPGLVPTLMPFQRRSLGWMLARERSSAAVVDQLPFDFCEQVVAPLFDDSKPQVFWIDRFSGAISIDFPQKSCVSNSVVNELRNDRQPDCFTGGILAEEMGLGKTIILLALILSNPLTETSVPSLNILKRIALDRGLDGVTAGTLIITPASILEQWQNELNVHAPLLSVSVFDPSHADPDSLSKMDVVLASYEQLRKEVHAARAPPDRPRRFGRQPVRRISALIQLLWWRVVLDEAQMVESSMNNAAEMARLIPRVHPWGVTGTPASKTATLADLKGMFVFLGLDEWNRLAAGVESVSKFTEGVDYNPFEQLTAKPKSTYGFAPKAYHLMHMHGDLVYDRLRQLMHRATKSSVAHELVLPPQHEHELFLRFDRVQQMYYDDIREQCVQAVLEARDAGTLQNDATNNLRRTRSSRQTNTSTTNRSVAARIKLGPRVLLLQMRQTCCHPQVGTHNRRVLGGDLRTMDEVLDVMIRQTTSLCYTLHYERILSSFGIAHTHEYQDRFKPAMDIYQMRLKEIQDLLENIRSDLNKLEEKRRRVHGLTNTSNASDDDGIDAEDEAAAVAEADRAAQEQFVTNDDDQDDQDDGGNPDKRTPNGRTDLSEELGQVRNRLRFWTELEHRVLYFIACVYFSVGKRIDDQAPAADEVSHASNASATDGVVVSLLNSDCVDSETGWTRAECEENEQKFYELADQLRRQTLQPYEARANKLIQELDEHCKTTESKLQEKFGLPDAPSRKPAKELGLIELGDEFYGGIMTHEVFVTLHEVVDLLNKQWSLLHAWRHKLASLLKTPLSGEYSGSESDNIVVAGPSNASSSRKSISLADKSGDIAPTGEEYAKGLDVQEEVNQYQHAYNQMLIDRLTLLTGGRRESERRYYGQSDLQHELFQQRKAVTLRSQQQALSQLIERLRQIMQRPEIDKDEEQVVLEMRLASNAHRILSKHLEIQMAALELLQNEAGQRFSVLGNARILFFKELQKFDTGVTLPPRPDDLDAHRQTLTTTISDLERQLATQMGRRRYLEHLSSDQAERIRAQTKNGSSRGDGNGANGNNPRLDLGRECGICKQVFRRGVVTPCGHILCEDCGRSWLRQNNRCPMCNQNVTISSVVRVSFDHWGKQASAGIVAAGNHTDAMRQNSAESSQDANESAASNLQHDLVEQLSHIRIDGSFGIKIDTIVRLIKHLQSEKQGQDAAKVVLFSQWEQVLDIIGQAFKNNQIGFIRIDGVGWTPSRGAVRLHHRGESAVAFGQADEMVVFLLNAKSQSSGLTLVCATHVVLVEPVVHRSIEMQALGRVHRIGQTQATHVWRLVVQDTVEEQIHARALERIRSQSAGGSGGAADDDFAVVLRAKLARPGAGGGEALDDADVEALVLAGRDGVDEGSSTGRT